jgi:Family of unknown function (DUF5335)
MTTRKLDKAEWHPYLDNLSRWLIGKRAEIEVASLSLGDQIEAKQLPLLGVTYDPKDDIVEIQLDGIDHLIHKPRELYLDEEAGELVSLEVVDADGTHQIIKLSDPLALPPPAH